MMDILLKKLAGWLPKNISSILGIIEAVVKLLKELVTLALTLVAPIIPGDKDEELLNRSREVLNKIYDGLSKVKDFLLKMGN